MKAIEDAVRALGGVWPSHELAEMYLYQFTGGRYAAGLSGGTARYICTRFEFYECDRRLRNEPSWDDAPDWAMAKAQDNDGWWHWYSHKLLRTSKATGVWQYNSTPGRYLRATQGEVIGDWKRTMELRPEEEEKVESKDDCHEKGEFPPFGTMVSYPTGSGVLLLPPDDVDVVVVLEMRGDRAGQYKRVASNAIRPLQTERERWIEAAQKALFLPSARLGEIYDAGLAKMPEDG